MPFPVFGAGAVQTAYVSFLALDISDKNITLVWPTSYVDAPNEDGTVNVLGASMTVNTAAGNANTITLPDATQTTVGANFIITNVGQSGFNLLKSDGSILVNIPTPLIPSGTSTNMTAGEVTINTPLVQANSVVQLSVGIHGGTHGQWRVSAIVPGVSFTVRSSSGTETSTVNWAIMHSSWISGTSAALGSGVDPGEVFVNAPTVTANSKILLTNNTFAGTLGTLSNPIINPGVGFIISSSNTSDTSTVNWTIVQQTPDLTQGTAELTAGEAEVTTSAVNLNSIILLTYKHSISAGEYITVTTITPGERFFIESEGSSDSSTVNWAIFSTTPYNFQPNSYWVQLTDNSTSAGTWQLIQFGAGTSAATPSVLAGNGLTAIESTLNTNIPVQEKSTPYTILPSDRANLIVWSGGTATITLPLVSTVPAGFYVSFNNASLIGGVLSISGNESNVDGRASISVPISPIDSTKQSLTVISDGVNWWTLGFNDGTVVGSFLDGSATNPSIYFTREPNTGIYRILSPSSSIGFSVNGVLSSYASTAGLTAINGTSANPSISFIGAPTSGLYYNSPNISVSIGGIESLRFSHVETPAVSSTLAITNSTEKNLTLSSVNNSGVYSGIIGYNGLSAINISTTGIVTFSLRQSTLDALMPTGTLGNLIWYTGGDHWAVIAPPTLTTQRLTPQFTGSTLTGYLWV